MEHNHRHVRICSIIVLVGVASYALAAKHYNPEWGPAPPCPPHSMHRLPSQKVVKPFIFPVLGRAYWNDDYTFNRGGFRHAAIDIKAPKMSPIVAPFSGILGMKSESFWIYGDDGWLMLGTHLNNDDMGTHDKRGGMDVMFAPNLKGGQHVYAGQFIGYVGMSGNATGPHLHFELYAPGRGPTPMRVRDPYLSLKYAQWIRQPRIRLSGERPGKGTIRLDGCIRHVDSKHEKITLILFAKQFSNGRSTQVLGPHYVKFNISQTVVDEAGGWPALNSIREFDAVTCYLPMTTKLDGARIERLTIAREVLARATRRRANRTRRV